MCYICTTLTCSFAQLRTLWHSFEEERLLLCPSRVLFHELHGIVAFMQTCSLMLDTCTVHFALYFNIWVRTCSNFISTAISKFISVPVSVICDYLCYYHCVKVVCIRSFSGVYFSVFGLNTEIYPVNLCIQCECGKKTDQKNSEYGNFLLSVSRKEITELVEKC